mmetsp:Transcript_74278/g.120644  ORF Transcript_74278/g.120644 Transcript_74278/m.120644 type:complete len:207 (+) Transcript_74278:18-638(+)
MSTPADGVLGGIAHIAALGASMHFIILPLARPKNATYDKTDDEETIKLPFRPPLVVMASWGAAFVARELAKVFAPTFSFSRLLEVRSTSIYAAGLALWTSSMALAVYTVRTMNAEKTPVPHGAGVAQKIVTHGPFRYFRHPIYIGFIGSSLSTAFIFDSILSLVGVCMSGGYIVGHVMPVEEAWMQRKFGKEWTDYCDKVKRFILF